MNLGISKFLSPSLCNINALLVSVDLCVHLLKVITNELSPSQNRYSIRWNSSASLDPLALHQTSATQAPTVTTALAEHHYFWRPSPEGDGIPTYFFAWLRISILTLTLCADPSTCLKTSPIYTSALTLDNDYKF